MSGLYFADAGTLWDMAGGELCRLHFCDLNGFPHEESWDDETCGRFLKWWRVVPVELPWNEVNEGWCSEVRILEMMRLMRKRGLEIMENLPEPEKTEFARLLADNPGGAVLDRDDLFTIPPADQP